MINVKKLYFGGDIGTLGTDFDFLLTGAGRFSLNIVLGQDTLKGKRMFLPDFICHSVVDCFQQMKIPFTYYSIKSWYDFALPELKESDCLYFVKYFGQKMSPAHREAINNSRCTLILDDVFSPVPETPNISGEWFSYNSMRKLGIVPDGSMLISNIEMQRPSIKPAHELAFANLKRFARKLKFNYVMNGAGKEERYVQISREAESCLDSAKECYDMSPKSLLEFIDFLSSLDQKRIETRNNYKIARDLLSMSHPVTTEFYSYIPLKFEQPLQVQSVLRKSGIFLPIHWPNINNIANQNYGQYVSLPLHSSYREKDIRHVCEEILKLESE